MTSQTHLSEEVGDVQVFMAHVLDLIPEKRQMLLRATRRYYEIADDMDDPLSEHVIKVTIDNQKLFNRIKFTLIKYLKSLPKPEMRVLDFEFRDSNGLPNFDEFERLVESRKTRLEKESELQEELELKHQFEEAGLEYHGPLRSI